MAKAKKSEENTESKPAAKKAAPAKKPAEAKKKSAAPASSQGGQGVDTNLAAQNAARMLVAGAHSKQTSSPAQPQKQESSMFKQMKAGLNKPSSSAMGNMLDKSGGSNQKKSNLPFGGKQVGHNQTFGSNVTRSGVPRRTSG